MHLSISAGSLSVVIVGNTIEKYIWDGSKVVSVSEEWLRSHKHRHGTVAERLTRLKVSCAHSSDRHVVPSAVQLPVLKAAASTCFRSLMTWVVLQDGLTGAFFPKPDEVTPDYWDYTKWRAVHRLCSAILQNFSTQVCPPLLCLQIP